MSLGVGAYKVGGAGQCTSMRRRYLWQPCEQPPPNRELLGAWGCWSRRFHFIPVRWPLFFQAPKRFRLGGAGGARVLAGLPWIPPPLARALPGSTNFVGTNAQAHLLVMSLTAHLLS